PCPFRGPATAELYTLSLHDALPISCSKESLSAFSSTRSKACFRTISSVAKSFKTLRSTLVANTHTTLRSQSLRSQFAWARKDKADRKSTRLNSSHVKISYAVFCLNK